MVGWLVGLVAFVPLGLLTGPRLLGVDRTSGRVIRAGSPVSLVRNLLIFAAQYGSPSSSFVTRRRRPASPWPGTRCQAHP